MIGTTVGAYRITSQLSEGGMGTVWTATHSMMGKDAVIKFLLPELSNDEAMVRRFFNEARAAASIQDAGIVNVFDVGTLPDGRAYIVMEKLRGQSLSDRLRARRFRVEEAAVVLRLLARSLEAAHANGIVHRDLKPDNIFLVPDRDIPGGERTKIRTAGATVRAGVPVFDTGREEFTKSVNGSSDMRPQWDVDGEGIYFDSDRTNRISNIWYKRRESRGYTQLTFHDKNAWYPSISKDGNKIAYQVSNPQVGAGWSIWMVDRDGRSATELGAGEHPQFSPDGTKIAFAQKDANGNSQIWVMDASGGNRIQLTTEFNNELPTWHPGGKKLVFVSNRSGNADVWMVETEGARMVQLTNYLGLDMTPEFTPDGRYLMFASTRGGEIFHLWMGELSDH